MTERDYEKIYATLALDETLVSKDPRATIKHSPQLDTRRTLDTLPLLHVGRGTDGAELQIGRTLGEGGMGIIRAATQAPFGREVALKTVRDDRTSDHAVRLALVREAIAAGRLEHPHIVPIYAVGRDADGHPLIVMKRIDGASWREQIADPDLIPDDDPLRWHLGVFEDVCAAVHFAHVRGVIHRDLKLDNVMIGAHEDVYVVDWGLAMTLMPDPAHQLPFVGEVNEVVGTPAYMAPEMAAGGTEPVDERTDVYLLGTMLHEVLTGEPRHQGSRLYEIMLNAYRSAPIEYGGDVPEELAGICNRATARDPDDRFQTALELRDAVQQFIDHRGAAALTEDAREQLAELERALRDDDLADDDRRVAVYRTYGAARFGLERSLDEWADQPAARDGLQRTLELMIDWELSHGSVHTAEALLADLPKHRDELAAQIAEVARNQSAERAELEALRDHKYQQDVSVGARNRAAQAALLIVGGMVLPSLVVLAFDLPFDEPLVLWFIAFIVCAGAIAFSVLAWRRETGFLAVAKTRTNRRISIAVVVVCAYIVFFRGFSLASGVPIPTQLAFELCGFAMFAGTVAALLDRRLAGSAALYLAASLTGFAYPEVPLLNYVIGNSLALAWVAWVWRRPPDE